MDLISASALKEAQKSGYKILSPIEEIMIQLLQKANSEKETSLTLRRNRIPRELKAELEQLGYKVEYKVCAEVGPYKIYETEISW